MNSKEEFERRRKLDFNKQVDSAGSTKKLNEEFLDAIRCGNPARIQAAFDKGASVNYQSDETGFSPLHMAAACGARHAVRALVALDETDYLLRDKQGRLASELAYLGGHQPDVAVSRLLGMKEVKQAEKLGVTLSR
ncbi:ankyrin repeat domain-containing protein [Marinobacterium sedimentorum]|uniref:ankyrin repeat domain-containing protein n=1 Tax=Marinobacterium sedimentorum TaxID=2927804 RepID=UPI0020C71EE0|nr:ankyrin repeat domain-containing protein [Marinobacterium sedimentorum]MCP8685946.1 ankyrin repeat domain-containing protein [Marinobacterium sedimentorum]